MKTDIENRLFRLEAKVKSMDNVVRELQVKDGYIDTLERRVKLLERKVR